MGPPRRRRSLLQVMPLIASCLLFSHLFIDTLQVLFLLILSYFSLPLQNLCYFTLSHILRYRLASIAAECSSSRKKETNKQMVWKTTKRASPFCCYTTYSATDIFNSLHLTISRDKHPMFHTIFIGLVFFQQKQKAAFFHRTQISKDARFMQIYIVASFKTKMSC